MGKFSIFAWNSLLAAVLGLFTYGSFKGMVGVFVLFVGLGITALLGFIPFIGPFLYLVLALFVVTPWVYST
ncbi:MAG: hypothetical protein SVV03_03655, partial [Candidatus Nanohaloarchaea archaeon]|nr:hypothetical protein [Candidatus Nanohaloarchaea archaeon]